MKDELTDIIKEVRATSMALDIKIKTIKKRLEHHIKLKDAHKEPMEGI